MKRRRPDGTSLEDWIEPLTLRGRLGRPSSANKGLIDCSAVRDVAPAFVAEFGMEMSEIRQGADPPDVTVDLHGCTTSIEIIELMKPSVREKRVKEQAITFSEQLWSENDLVTKLNTLLDKKDALYRRRSDGFVADILLIVSCELWLDPADVEQWLANSTFAPRRTIASAYFAQERLPNWSKPHWPLFRLYAPKST